MTNMRKLFNDILNTKGVKGILLFSFSGDLIFKEYIAPYFLFQGILFLKNISPLLMKNPNTGIGTFLLNLWKACAKPIWSLKRAESTSAEQRSGIWSY
jgi:hypothetical protein